MTILKDYESSIFQENSARFLKASSLHLQGYKEEEIEPLEEMNLTDEQREKLEKL